VARAAACDEPTIGTFINAMIRTIRATGSSAWTRVIRSTRAFDVNYETIYLRSASRQQASAVVAMLRRSWSTSRSTRH